MTDLQGKWAAKIAALLKKAESTTPEEAELLFEKAQQLMSKYAIEQAMLDAAEGRDEQIVERTIVYTGIYHQARFNIGDAIARAQDCKTMIGRFPKHTTLYIIGFESDVERAIMLDSSVQIQAQAAMVAWSRDHVQSWMSPMEKFKERRQFMFGFAAGLSTKLQAARRAGREEAQRDAVASGRDETAVAAGMELVIRSRKDRVQDWYDKMHANARPVSRRYSRGSGNAAASGSAAGRNADIGSAGRIKSRKELSS